MLSQVKSVSIGILLPVIASIILSSCGVALEQSYYDEDFHTEVMPTSSELLGANNEGERAVGWLLWTRESIYLGLQLQYTASNHHRFEMPQGNILSFEFADGASYQLINSLPVRSRRGVVQDDADQVADVYIPLSNDDMNALLAKQIVALNVQTSNRYSRFIIKSNKDLAIKKMILLVRPPQQAQVKAVTLKLPRIR